MALLAITAVAGADDAPPDPVIRYGQDVLTVRVSKMPVSQVLAELARQSGAEIRGEPADEREITAQFDDVPLGEALYRLLGDQNYALVYGDGGKLRAVRLLGGPGGGSVSIAAAASPIGVSSAKAPIATTGRPTRDMRAAADQRSPAAGPAEDTLAPAVAGFQRIGDFWLRGDDAISREAARSELSAIEAEPESRTEAVNLANSYSDTEFADLLRQIAGSRAEELAGFIASSTRVTELRLKALSVQHVLQNSGS